MLIFQANSITRDCVAAELKQQLQALPAGTLPLHLCTTQGGIVDDSNICVSVLNTSGDGDTIRSKITVFFDEIVSGCSCGDGEQAVNACGELLVSIDRHNAEMRFEAVPQQND